MDRAMLPVARFLLTRSMLDNGTIPLRSEVARALSGEPMVVHLRIATPDSKPVPAIAHWAQGVVHCPKLKSLIGKPEFLYSDEAWFILCAVQGANDLFVIVPAPRALAWWNELEDKARRSSNTRPTRVARKAASERAAAPARSAASSPKPAPTFSPEPRPDPESRPEPEPQPSPEPDFDEEARKLVDARLISLPESPITVDNQSVEALVAALESEAFGAIAQSRVHDRSLQLSMSPGFDQLLSLDAVRGIVPFEYQVGAVRQVLQKMRGRAILADEVGLGKTIEAGLILMEYIMRGLVRRVLVLCPRP